MNKRIAIDFGTTNTVVAKWNPVTNSPETIKFDEISIKHGEMPPIIPSLLYIEDEELTQFIIGQQVRDKGLDNIYSDRFFSGFKKRISEKYESLPKKIGEHTFENKYVCELYLKRILEQVNIDNQTEIVITIPVDSFETYRKWIIDFFDNASGSPKIQILDESTAAAIGYGYTKPNSCVAVIDFGGGTLDISIIKMPNFSVKDRNFQESATVISKAGRFIGGEDIDEMILNAVLKQSSTNKEQVKHIYSQLKQTAEQVKNELSYEAKAEFSYFDAKEFKTYSMNFTRELLEGILVDNNFYVHLNDVIQDALITASMKGVTKDKIERVMMVGGTCIIPSVQKIVKDTFGSPEVGVDKPFEAVAHGALFALQGLNIKDYLSRSYAIRFLNLQTRQHDYKIIFYSGVEYPTSEPIEFTLSSAYDNQEAIELVIAEIRHKKQSEVSFDSSGNFIMHSEDDNQVVVLNEGEEVSVIARLQPKGMKNDGRLKVFFSINEKRQLTASVFDNGKGMYLYRDLTVVDLK